MGDFLGDVRHSVRMFLKTPGFTLTALAALALGIGVNTAVFSVVNTVLLRPLPFPDPDRLVLFMTITPSDGGSGTGASPVKFNSWRVETGILEDAAAFHNITRNITSAQNPEQVRVGEVSARFFPLFGATTVQGRTFTAEEDTPGGAKVAVLGHGIWRRRYGSDPAIVGKSLSLDGQPHTIIGVLSADFRADGLVTFAAATPEIWIPFKIDPASQTQGHYFVAAARLKPGISLESARARMQLAGDEFRKAYPNAMQPNTTFGLERIRDVQVRGVRSSLLILFGAVGFVLLIACSNVANLLLVRASVRTREIAIRAAVGAGRARIVRQLLTESVLLALTGGAAGLVLGMAGIRGLLALNPGNIPRIGIDGANVTLDWKVAAFTLAVSVTTGLVFGLVPALNASRADLSGALKESSGRSGTGHRHNRIRAILVVTEVALALVLLVGAALLIRTFVALRRVDPGFESSRVLTMRMALSDDRFKTTGSTADVIRRGVDALRAIPGVEHAAATCCIPLEGGYGLPFVIPGRPHEGPYNGGGGWYTISPAYFSVFKIPVVRGRAFTEADGSTAPPVVIINQAMAKQYWADGDPLSSQLIIGGRGVGPEFVDPPRQIVGVVGDVRDGGLNNDPRPAMYVPFAQIRDELIALNLSITPLAWIVRTHTEPFAVSTQVQEPLRQASGGLAVAQIRSMDEIVGRSTASADFNMLLLTTFGVAALLLAAIGVYGLMAYSVEQRTQEIGIRRALGADAGSVRNLIVIQGMRLSIAGLLVGIAGAFATSKVLATLLFGVTPRDPLVFVGAPLVLAAVALLAVWFPACRASRVDPLIALRQE